MGLRETKKLATRQQIAAVAMRLFAMKGFDHVTVSEIAAEAGVSVKTVFNYFPTKEDLFFDEVPERLRRITEAIKDRPPSETILDSLRRLQLSDAPRMCSDGFAVFARIVTGVRGAQAEEVDVMARFSHAATTLQEGGASRSVMRALPPGS
jgi:AcrR family transcriptional regulator